LKEDEEVVIGNFHIKKGGIKVDLELECDIFTIIRYKNHSSHLSLD